MFLKCQDWTGLNFQEIMAEADAIKTTVSLGLSVVCLCLECQKFMPYFSFPLECAVSFPGIFAVVASLDGDLKGLNY